MRIHPLTGMAPQHKWPIREDVRGGDPQVGRFGMTRTSTDGKPKMHKGVDYLAAPGAAVFAIHDGEITRAGEQLHGKGFGQRVYLRSHDGSIESIYAHLSGQIHQAHRHVRAGDLIGWVGRSGNVGADERACSTHLHLEIRRKIESDEMVLVDPDLYLYPEES